MSEFFLEIWPDTAAGIGAGLFLTFIFFFLKEHIFCIPQIGGIWECKLTVEETENNPFKGMQVWYQIVILQNGNLLTGTGEKDREISSKNPTSHRHQGKSRIFVEVSGVIQKRYTGFDVINIQWKEYGENRPSSTVHSLKISGRKRDCDLIGIYYSSAGKCKGQACWSRQS